MCYGRLASLAIVSCDAIKLIFSLRGYQAIECTILYREVRRALGRVTKRVIHWGWNVLDHRTVDEGAIGFGW